MLGAEALCVCYAYAMRMLRIGYPNPDMHCEYANIRLSMSEECASTFHHLPVKLAMNGCPAKFYKHAIHLLSQLAVCERSINLSHAMRICDERPVAVMNISINYRAIDPLPACNQYAIYVPAICYDIL